MGALVDDLVLDSGEPIEDDGSGSTLDVVDGCLCKGDADGERHGELRNGVENGGHFEGYSYGVAGCVSWYTEPLGAMIDVMRLVLFGGSR